MFKNYLNYIENAFSPTLIAWASIFGGMIFFVVLERFFPAQKNQDPKGMLTNIKLSLISFTFNFFAVFFLGMLITKIVSIFGGPWIKADLSSILANHHGISKLLMAAVFIFVPLFAFDFFYYWFHRSQHTMPWLWILPNTTTGLFLSPLEN